MPNWAILSENSLRFKKHDTTEPLIKIINLIRISILISWYIIFPCIMRCWNYNMFPIKYSWLSCKAVVTQTNIISKLWPIRSLALNQKWYILLCKDRTLIRYQKGEGEVTPVICAKDSNSTKYYIILGTGWSAKWEIK